MGALSPGPERNPHNQERRQEAGLEAGSARGSLGTDPNQSRETELDARRRISGGPGPRAGPETEQVLERHAVPRQRPAGTQEAPRHGMVVPTRIGRRVARPQADLS